MIFSRAGYQYSKEEETLDSNPDWKKLYQDCKRELDHHEQKLVELQKALLKLALGFIGRNEEFDKLLKLITKTVRESENNNDAIIEGKLIAVINGVAKFSEDDKQQLIEQSEPDYVNKYEQELPSVTSAKFAAFLQKIPSELEMQAEIEVLSGRVKLTHSEEELEQLLEEAAILISEYYNTPATQITAGSESNNQQLVQLLENISFDKSLLREINHTKSILTGKIADEKRLKAYELVADLINNSMLQNEGSEGVADFLREVTHRLELLHKYLDQSDLIASDHFSESFSFSQDLDDQFKEIRNGLESSGSITAMKFNIEAHLDFLNKNVSDYVRKEKARMKRAEETMGALNSQVGDLKDKAAVLEKSVSDEKIKSLTDALTSIANRRAYEERLKLEIARWQRDGGHLSLMVFDLDKFKSINDNYGHVVGDKVLRGLTTTFQRGIRRTDFLARYGGEEFVMIIPGTSLDETVIIADKLRNEVEQCVFRYQGQVVPVTVSIGVAEFHENDTGESVFARADEALYLAKNSGRNICRSEAHLAESA